MRKIGIINFIDDFFYAGLALVIPLYLIQKGINVEDVGFILSIIPLAILVLRTSIAVFSEVAGTRLFFTFQGATEVAAAIAYLAASNPISFAFAKIFEGASYASFWAVDRTVIFEDAEYNKKNRAIASSRMLETRTIGGTAGIIVATLIIANAPFDYFFILLAILGFITIITSSMLRDTSKHRVTFSKLVELGKTRKFWEVGISLGLNFSTCTLLFFFILPVFLDVDLDADFWYIGMIMAMFYISMGVGGFIAEKVRLREKPLMRIELLGVPLILALQISGMQYFPIVIVLVGISYGVSSAILESVVSKTVGKSKYISIDVALLHMPGRVFEIILLFCAGIIYTFVGAWVLFALVAIMFGISVIMFDRYLGKKSRNISTGDLDGY